MKKNADSVAESYQKCQTWWEKRQFLPSLLEHGEVNPLKKGSWTYSLNITFTPAAMVTYGNKILAIQNKTPALASE